MKILNFFAVVAFLSASILSSCQDTQSIIDQITDDSNAVELKRKVTVSSSLEQHRDATKTALEKNGSVVWNDGDEFAAIYKSEVSQIRVTATSTSAGLGIKVPSTDYIYVRYSAIKVEIGGTDVTSTILSSSTASNTYKVGIYNSTGNYQFAPAGKIVTAQLNGSVIPLVQTSSSSKISTSNTAVVTLTNVEYSNDTTAWISVTDDVLVDTYGNKSKTAVTHTFSSFDKCEFEISDGQNGKTSADFTADVSADLDGQYGFYPYSSYQSFDGENITFSLPQVQYYSENSFASNTNPSIGVFEPDVTNSDTYHIQFKNVCGVLELQLKGTQVVSSIELADKDENAMLWGTGKVPVSGIDDNSCSAVFTEGSNTITLDCGGIQLDSETATPFYFVVPTGSFKSGFTVKIYTDSGYTIKSTSKSNEILRSDIKEMPAFSISKAKFSLEEFNIENDIAKGYLENAVSTFTSENVGSYGQAFFDKYINSSGAYDGDFLPDQPNSKKVCFSRPGYSSATSATIYLSTDCNFTSLILESDISFDSAGSASYSFTNLVPETTYYYKVVCDNSIIRSGVFKAVGQLRMIALSEGFNIRDLGGWTAWNDHSVRYEQIYRGGSLGGTSPNSTQISICSDDIAELERIGVSAQLDLRAEMNSGKYVTGESSNHSYTLGSSPISSADFNNTMTDYGAYNNDASLVSDVAWIIYELKRGKHVYFNCRQGADRTGALAFLIEGLLGCYEYSNLKGGNQMAMDYELTGLSQANKIDNTKSSSSYRGACSAAQGKVFNAILNLNVSGVSSIQDKCYYYLNRYWINTSINKTLEGSNTSSSDKYLINIGGDDLNWFINYMLGLVEIDGTSTGKGTLYTGPSFTAAESQYELKTVAEKNANKVSYK